MGNIEGTGEITGSPVNSSYKNVKYIDENGKEQTADNALGISSSNVLWSNNWYVVKGEVTLTNRVEIQGDVHLILEDGAKLIAPFGIKVQDDDNNVENGSLNSLTIYAQSTDSTTMGSIEATVSDDNTADAAIGSNGSVNSEGSLSGDGMPNGNITINGGNINATSPLGAAIGGGSGIDCGAAGSITINDGIITCINTEVGAGIGGGYGIYNGGSGGNITINGGTINAKSSMGAGIGGAFGVGVKSGDGGTITITGGNITAESESGSGIGSGGNYQAASGDGGTITISGGHITATSVEGIGIGGAETGTFTTGENGNAYILASSIADKSQIESWHGIIFDGTSGKVYGDVTPEADFEVPENYTLDIPENTTLTIAENITMTNNGIVTVLGTVEKLGTIICNSHLGGTVTCTELAACSLCGEKYGSFKPHSIVESDGKEPTCEESGYEACWICENCGKLFIELGKPVEIPARGHKLTKTEGKEATCGESGYEAYWTCEACNKMFSDADGINEIEAPVEIPALGHKYEDGVCINCGQPEIKYELGDVNQDGKLDITDATLIQCYLVMMPIEGTFNKELADVNQDGNITIYDATFLQVMLTTK